ncbi:cupredoxin domain-containing protein [Sphingobium tyrosinilyticum]|uniref:Cupredoxin domain-containing protein n=1 Tax=Sphingobium tyrosinilyticum TaxID=2715436 RepID=A0ABV9EZ69_9SPHN
MSHRRSLAALTALVLSSSVTAQSDMWSNARPLTLSLSSFKFEPSEILLEHDAPYRLHFVNGSSGGHDFAAKTFFAAARIKPEDAGKIRGGRVEVGGGESVDVQLIAPSSPGTYKVRCTHFMHSAFGMTGKVIVR